MNGSGEMGMVDLSAAVARLKRGGVVAFPTETVYGLGADAFNADAVKRVFELKGRPSRNPLIVHVSGPEMARRVAADWPTGANRLASAFWPGPLSIVLPKKAEVSDIVTGGVGSTSVAVRCPDHPVALALLYEFGRPLVGPSANKSGSISPTTAAHVRRSFSESDVLVLDGGTCSTGIESTVVSLVETTVRVLRPGVIGAAELSRVLGCEVQQRDSEGLSGAGSNDPNDGPLASPGLLSKHYAPSVPARLVSSDELSDLVELWNSASAEPRVVMSWTMNGVPAPHTLLLMPSADVEYAAVLYAALRHAESLSPAEILIEEPSTDSAVWEAVWDRLRRACASA